jgi:hypothetical protein
MELYFTKELPLETEAFGAKIHDGNLYVPHELSTFFNTIPTLAMQLVSVIRAWPLEYQEMLGWDHDRFQKAVNTFIEMLEGKIAPTILHPEPVHGYPLGISLSKDDLVQDGYVVPKQDKS